MEAAIQGVAPAPSASLALAGRGPAAAHAQALLAVLGWGGEAAGDGPATPPALLWARSGAMSLTGEADGPPRARPVAVAVAMEGAALALTALARRRGIALALDGPALLGERAALAGLARRGRTAPGGASRLLRAADGWVAVTLARADDVAAIPAWLGLPAAGSGCGDPWPRVAAALTERSAAEVVARGRLIGLPVAPVAPPPAGRTGAPALRVAARGLPAPRRAGAPFLVVDLCALWAGPLCASLLGRAGGRVVKVESRSRPDGARAGPPRLFELWNAGKASVALDFETTAGRAALRGLLAAADVVVESGRPRALAQLGVDAEALVAARPGLTWVAISGHGRRPPGAGWVAFGDDAAAAGGLAALAGEGAGQPLCCADAVADPLTGLHAAAAALAAHEAGGGVLLDLSLSGVARAAAALDPEAAWGRDARLRGRADALHLVAEGETAPVCRPRARPGSGPARQLGADTAAILGELGIA